MEPLFNRNGLMFWTEEEIRLRAVAELYLVTAVKADLRGQNRAWEVVQVEAPVVMPHALMDPNYTDADVFAFADTLHEEGARLVLRPETTAGSYAYAKHLLKAQRGFRMPLCVWQHGLSFRREQDQPIKNMRLKSFYQLEFQCVYAADTKNDYSASLIPSVRRSLSELVGACHVTPSDRLPDYAQWTQDVVCDETQMEVCSISLRNDFEGAKVLEVAVGTDRCVYHMMRRREALASAAG